MKKWMRSYAGMYALACDIKMGRAKTIVARRRLEQASSALMGWGHVGYDSGPEERDAYDRVRRQMVTK